MPAPRDVYIHCDELDRIPAVCRENWERELAILVDLLPQQAKVLQVGCMDGSRMIALLTHRPDLQITGSDIEPSFVALARQRLAESGLHATVVEDDITHTQLQSSFDYVLCLNNTLGYISDQERARATMHALGQHTTISVYGERFSDAIAQEYFTSLGLTIESIERDHIHLADFGSVRRYSRAEIDAWSEAVKELPIGYLVTS